MNFLTSISHWLGGLLRPQNRPQQPPPPPQKQAAPNYNLGNFLAQQLNQVNNNPGVQSFGAGLKARLSGIGNTHLQGIEQLTGKKNVTIGNVAKATPVLGQAIKFGQTQNPTVGQFTRGIAGAGIQGAGYVVPEAKIIKVPGLAARFVNQAAPAAGMSVAGDLVGGNRNAGNIAQNAALNGGLAGGANALLGLRRAGVQVPTQAPKIKVTKTPAMTAKVPAAKGLAPMSENAYLAHAASPDMPPNAAKLPAYQIKKESAVAKALMPTVDIIKRQGTAGKKLGSLVDNQVNSSELYQADLARQAPTLFKLGRKERANFGDVVEGKALPINAKQAQAVQEWNNLAPQIRERGLQAGLEIGNQAKDGAGYFPHMIDFDKLGKRNNFNVAVNHLVSTGQAKSPEEAIQLLNYAQGIARSRPDGNLEASRLVDIPFYDKSTNAIGRYVSGASKRITHVETFGNKDEKALRLITKIARDGGDSEAAKNAFDVAVGAKQYGQTAAKTSAKLRQFNTLTKLGTAQISNLGQSVNTATVTGYHRLLKGAIDALSPEGKDFVQKSGVVANSVINDLANQQGAGGWVGKIGAPGFGTVEKANRTMAALAGRKWASDLAAKGGEKNLKILSEKLGVTGTIGKELTEAQQIQAARKIVEISQFKTGPKDLPGWADSPAGKLVAQFRTFPYKQGNFLLKEVLKPASQGNVVPLARFLAALPIGYGIYETKNILRNRPSDATVARKTFESFQALGGAGLAGSLVQGVIPRFGKYLPPGVYASQVAGTLLGPTASTLGRYADAVGSAATGKFTPAGRVALGTIPIVGGTLQNTLLPYQGVGNRTANATASSSSSASVSPEPAATAGGGSILTGDNTSPEYKAAQKAAKQAKKDGVVTGARLGGTVELDAAQQRIDTASKNLPTNMSKQSKNVLLRYAKLNENGKAVFDEDPRNKYLLEVAKYERDVKSGKLDVLKDFTRQQSIGKLEVTSRYSKEAQTLYSMSKVNRNAFLAQHPEYTKYMDEAASLDAELAAKGWIAKAKLGGGSAGSRAYTKLAARIKTRPVKLKKASFRSLKVKRVKVKA